MHVTTQQYTLFELLFFNFACQMGVKINDEHSNREVKSVSLPPQLHANVVAVFVQVPLL